MRKPDKRKIKWFADRVLDWYDENGRHFPWRKEGVANYRRVVVEVLLQRTRAETVAAFYPLFFKKYPSFKALAETTLRELEASLKPIGLWKRRARSLKGLGEAVVEKGDRFPLSPDEFETYPAVGQYVGNAARVFVYGERAPLLDVNMARVLERFFGPRQRADIRYDPWLQGIAHDLVDNLRCIETNWAILDLAARICRQKKPLCEICPLEKKCSFSQEFENSEKK